MGPEELDDLLASIRAESKEESKEEPKGGALALYEGARETDLVSEVIDERILRLLGLEQVFDIDYSTYMTLLKEKVLAARMVNSKLSTDESELVTNEYRRVKGKVGRFKISRKKITSESLGVSGKVPISPERFFLTSKAVIPPQSKEEGGEESTSPEILSKLDELIAAIRKDNDIEKKKQETERRQKQNKRREERENRLEKVSKPVQRLMNKVVKPFQSILDRILKFFIFTFLGFAFNKFMDWFGDPKNQKKIESIGRFLKDWWPSLLGAAALFFTPFGIFVKGTISLLKFLLPNLIKLTKLMLGTKGGLIATAVLATGAGVMTALNRGENVDEQRDILQKIMESTDLSLPDPQNPVSAQAQGGIVPNLARSSKKIASGFSRSISGLRDSDGKITKSSGLDITGAGPDTQLVAAKPGEIVIPTETVSMYGSDYFMNLIRSSGNTGIPQIINGIQLANDGGMVGGLRIPKSKPSFKPPMIPSMGRMNTSGSNFIPSSSGPSKDISSGSNFIPPSSGASENISSGSKFIPSSSAQESRNVSPIGSLINSSLGSQSSVSDISTGGETNYSSPSTIPSSSYSNVKNYNVSLGPRKMSVQMPGTPVVRTNMQVINLPPETLPPKTMATPVRTGTDIPKFNVVSNNSHRSVVSTVLGISDLVG